MAFLLCVGFGVEVPCGGLVMRASPLNWALGVWVRRIIHSERVYILP